MVSRYRTLTAADETADQMLTLSTARTGDPLKAELMPLVEQTHLRQTVSHINHPRRLPDNRCWLRSSRLSLMSCAEPAQLAQRLREIGGPDEDAVLLQRIAERFRADPSGFMQTRRSNAQIAVETHQWQSGAGKSAYLGDAQPLSAIFSDLSLTSPTNRLNIEGWLHDLNLILAATTRLENPLVINQLDGLKHKPSLATSDLPIALHRVFQQPALVVEIGPVLTRTADGVPDSRLAQLRMSVPKGSSLEQTLAALAGESELKVDDPTQLQPLLREFAHLPIIWLEQEHYEVYFPRSAGRAA
jgi:hypothetical protein